jgi:hypothetical protein
MQPGRTLCLSIAATRLVLGLLWQPVVGRNPDAQARRQSRQQQATHLLLAGDPVSSFALAWLDGTTSLDGKPLHSAAYSFSQLFPGETVAMIMDLGEHGCWLVAAHNGSVIAGTDILYKSDDQARSELQTLCQAYPQLQCLHDDDVPELALLAASAGSQTILQSTSAWRRLRSTSTRILLFMLVGGLAWMWLDHRSEPISSSVTVPTIDPRAAWDTATRAYEQGRYLHGAGATQTVLQNLSSLPVHISGWALKAAQCSPVERRWQCQAEYERSRPLATYHGFLSAVPRSWTTSFPDLHRAQSRWQFDSSGVPLAQQWLSNSRENERTLLSSLQRMQTAFSRMEIGPSVSASIAPALDGKGLPISRPDGYPGYAQRRVAISGPLRSASLLLPHVAAMSWHRVALVLQDQEAADLRRSRLILTLEGMLYETDYAMLSSRP